MNMPGHPLSTAVCLAAALAGGVLSGCTNHVAMREKGFVAMRQGDLDQAIAHFTRAVELTPGDYKAQYYLGVNLLKADRAVAAQTPLEQALLLRTDDPSWRPKIADALAESYHAQGRVETLYAFLDDQVQAHHQQSADFLRLGKYLALNGDADGAKTALNKAAYFAPAGDPAPYIALADFYAAANDVPNQLLSLKHGYAVAPGSLDVQDRLRGLGVVPGPTVAVQPPKPELP